jgi:hypothetical protein
LVEVTTKFQQDPTNAQWQAETTQSADYLQAFEKKKVEGQLLRSRIKWKDVGDKCSWEFFQATRERSTASHITELADNTGQLHTSQPTMSQICQEFYGKLYTARVETTASAEAKAQALRHISNRLTPAMKATLSASVSVGELQKALSEMKLGKSSGPDGIILEFYREYWPLIGEEYLSMIQDSIRTSRFPAGVTTSMIALLFKSRVRAALSNWHPITLLNLSYKIYAKALQLQVQLILMETISHEQLAFLPLRFILDNILLTQQTMAWASQSQQALFFLKLDFAKAYDKVDWNFKFEAMTAMGYPGEFVLMVRLLFQDAAACVKVNGSSSKTFQIGRGVRQGCPLAPYLFLIVAEVLNNMVLKEVESGNVRSITLPVENRQQVLAQYADDTSFTLLGQEGTLRYLIRTLETFYLASGLVINWKKSSAHWKSALEPIRPLWTNGLGVTWAGGADISKLLGAPFGMSLTSEDVNSFLHNCITKKLMH